MLITDQVATAPCTDPIQQRFLTFEAKPPHIIIRDSTILSHDQSDYSRPELMSTAFGSCFNCI